jgi:hypothetical protein
MPVLAGSDAKSSGKSGLGMRANRLSLSFDPKALSATFDAGSPPAGLSTGIWTDGERILTPQMTGSETASDRPPAAQPSEGSETYRLGHREPLHHTGQPVRCKGRGRSKSRAKGAAAVWVIEVS